MKSQIQVRKSCQTVESPSLQTRISGTNHKSSLLHRHFSSFCLFFPPSIYFGLSYWWKLRSELQIQHRPVFKHPKPSSKARKFNGMIMLRAVEGSFSSKQQSTLTLVSTPVRGGICYDDACLPRATTEVLLPGKWLDTACWWEVENESFVFLCFCAQPLVLFLLNCLSFPPWIFFILFSPLPPCPAEEGTDRVGWLARGVQPESTHHTKTGPQVSISLEHGKNKFVLLRIYHEDIPFSPLRHS